MYLLAEFCSPQGLMYTTVSNDALGKSSLQPTRILTWAAIIRVELAARSSFAMPTQNDKVLMLLPVIAVFPPKGKPGIRTLTPMKSPTADRAILSRFGLQPPSAGFRKAPHTQTGKGFFLSECHGSSWIPRDARLDSGRPGRLCACFVHGSTVPWTVHVARGGFYAASGRLPFVDAYQKTMVFSGGAEPRALSSRNCWRNPPPHGLSPDQRKGRGPAWDCNQKKPRLLVSATRREGRAGGGAKGPTSRRIERVQRQGTGDDFRPGPPGRGRALEGARGQARNGCLSCELPPGNHTRSIAGRSSDHEGTKTTPPK